MTIARRMIPAVLISVLVVVILSVYFKLPGLLLIIGAIFGLSIMWLNVLWLKNSDAKANARIVEWARANGWQLLEFNREFSTGPFGGIHGRADLYFQFVILDPEGKKRAGWAYFDFSLLGGGRMQIKWNESVENPSN